MNNERQKMKASVLVYRVFVLYECLEVNKWQDLISA